MYYVHDQSGYIYSRFSTEADAYQQSAYSSLMLNESLIVTLSETDYPVGVRAIALITVVKGDY